jgi:hypothetical protein
LSPVEIVWLTMRLCIITSFVIAGYMDYKARFVLDLVWFPAIIAAVAGTVALGLPYISHVVVACAAAGGSYMLVHRVKAQFGGGDVIAMFALFLDPSIPVSLGALILGGIVAVVLSGWIKTRPVDPSNPGFLGADFMAAAMATAKTQGMTAEDLRSKIPFVTFLALGYLVTLGVTLIY